ncbi:hypothetical protein KOW79_006655 [Hemibagrus wyckioides]|uniref:Uncharacterized protein n=1 Tax=Hemibagrus wyckioides TaxID=337641 RepID=A0A9D3P038_9TELE|nr:hypothetical protein KOW79_006655 [Hemibagrus wyckioides]
MRSALASEAPGSLRKASASLGGLEPPTFRLTAERANRLRHRDLRAVVCPACPLAIRKSQAARTSRSSVSTNQPSVAGAHFDSPIGSHRLSPLCLRSALASEAPGSLRKASASLGGLEPPTFRLTAERANRLRHRDLRAVVCPACPLAIRKSQAARTSRSSVSTNQPSVARAHFDSPIGSHRLSPLCLRSALASEAPGSLRKASASLGGLEPPTFRLTAERANRLRHRDLRAMVCPACPLAIRKSQAARTSRSSVSTNQPSVAGAHFDSPIGSHRLSPLCLRSALASEAPGSLRKASASLGGLEPPTFRLTAERANRLRHRDLRAVVCPALPARHPEKAARTSRSSVSTNQPSVAGAHFDSPIGSHRLSPLCLRSALASEAPGSLRKASASLGGLEPPTFRLTAERANRLRHRDLRAVVCPACPLAIRKSQAARTSRSSVSTNQPSVAGAHFDSPIGSHRLSPLCLRSALASEAPGSLRKASASLGGLEPPTLTAERRKAQAPGASLLPQRGKTTGATGKGTSTEPSGSAAVRTAILTSIQAARTSRSSVSTNQPSVAGAHFDSPIGSHRLSPLCLRSALASEAPGSLRKASASLGGLEPPTFRLTAERANRLRHRDLRAAVCPACPLAIRKRASSVDRA